MRTPRTFAGVLVAVGVLATSGCYQGFTGTVSTQAPTGNGTDFVVGGTIAVQDTTVVADPAETSRAALSFSMVNNGDLPDSLVSVTTEPATEVSQTGPIEINPGAAVKVGGPGATSVQLAGLTVPPGSYTNVTFTFSRAGSVTEQIAVVPAAGYYEDYGPTARARRSTK